MRGTVMKRCGCVDPDTGRALGRDCPRLRSSRHGSWYYQLRLPGRRHPHKKGGFRTRADAEQALEALHRRIGAGDGEVLDQRLTVAEWLDYWLVEKTKESGVSAVARPVKRSTAREYRRNIEQILKPSLGALPLSKLRPEHITAVFDSISATNPSRRVPTTAATQERIFACLRAALNDAVRSGKLRSNPCARVRLRHASRPKPVVWTPERVAAWKAGEPRPKVAVWTPAQTGTFLDFAWTDRIYALYYLIAFNGLRRGEAAGLPWRNVDLDGANLTIEQQLVQYGREIEMETPKSEAGGRVVALAMTTVAILRAHRTEQLKEKLAWGSAYVGSGLVFTREDGSALRPDYVTSHFELLVRQAGLPPIRLHDLRHGAASLALAAGVDLKVVQHMLGHSSIALTADTYTSVLPQLARDAAEAATLLVPRRRG